MMENKLWKVGGYVRLSRKEDAVSLSIINQKEIIRQYISKHNDMVLFDYYVDDGYTGTNFDRPGFKRMMEDIRKKNIDVIVVKDLSRFGRNYIEVGNYLEYDFKINKIRFISINDRMDNLYSDATSTELFFSFKNLLNDEYCKDISKKVKSIFHSQMKEGKYLGGNPPFGYLRDENDKHKLVIDNNVSWIIKKIFNMALTGKTNREIALELNKDEIITPLKYRNPNTKYGLYWTNKCVGSILRNQVYCGDMVQGKVKNASYKLKKRIPIPKEEWVIVENTHEAIISKDIYEKIRKQRMPYVKTGGYESKKEVNLLNKYLRCHDCNRKMHIYTKRKTDDSIGSYCKLVCKTYFTISKDRCLPHYIDTDEIYDLLISDFKKQKTILDILKNVKFSESYKNLYLKLNKSINKVQSNVDEIYIENNSLYDDFINEMITADDYNHFHSYYVDNIKVQNAHLNNLKNKYDSVKRIIDDTNFWYDKISKLIEIDYLNDEILKTYIDIIYVNDDGSINVKYLFDYLIDEISLCSMDGETVGKS